MTEPLRVAKTSYSVLDFLEWQRQGTLDLRPFYQRRSVWNPRIKSLLMDSIIRGFPIPLVFLHSRLDVKTSRSVRQVVDGQQRLRTILSYIDPHCLSDPEDWDDFTILKSHNRDLGGKTFSELSESTQTTILQTSLSVNVLPTDIADVTVLQIFQRMNSTGLKLTDQEIRNGSYFGEFKDSSFSVAYEQNQRWLKWRLFSRQEIAQMKEVEFASELLGSLLHGVSSRSQSQITKLYRDHDEAFTNREEAEQKFRMAFEYLAPIYEERAGQVLPSRFMSTAWFYPLFAIAAELPDSDVSSSGSALGELPETQPVAVKPADLAAALVEVNRLISGKGELPDHLVDILRRQTTHKESRLQRIRLIRSVAQSR